MPKSILGWHILFSLTGMYPNLFMHVCVEELSDLSQFLAIMTRAVMHNSILGLGIVFQSSSLNTGSTLFGSQGKTCLVLGKIAKLAYKVAAHAFHQ